MPVLLPIVVVTYTWVDLGQTAGETVFDFSREEKD